MTKLFPTRGFVLGKRDFREADRIYTFFSDSLGKIEILVKGARKFSSKLSTHMETLGCLNLFLVDGRSGLTLAGVEVEKLFHINSWKLPLFFASANLVSSGTKWRHSEPDLFNVFFNWLDFLSELNAVSMLRQRLILGSFALVVVGHCGYMPELFQCLSCRKKIEQDQFKWSSAKGGVVCNNCSNDTEESWLKIHELDSRVLKLLRLAHSGEFNNMCKVEITESDLESFLSVIDSLILAHFPVIPSVSVAHMLKVED